MKIKNLIAVISKRAINRTTTSSPVCSRAIRKSRVDLRDNARQLANLFIKPHETAPTESEEVVLAFWTCRYSSFRRFVDEIHQFRLDNPVHRTGPWFCPTHNSINEVVIRRTRGHVVCNWWWI